MDEAASGCWSRLVELVFGRCCCRRPAGAAVGVAAAPAPCAVNSAKRTRAPDAWFLPAKAGGQLRRTLGTPSVLSAFSEKGTENLSLFSLHCNGQFVVLF